MQQLKCGIVWLLVLAACACAPAQSQPGAAVRVPKITAGDLITFFGFLIGTAVCTLLTALALRGVIRARRRRNGLLGFLVVVLGALLWNGWNLRQFVLRQLTKVGDLITFFGFLVGTVIFTILTALVLRDLIQARRRRNGLLGFLVVALGALLWNGWNLTLISRNIVPGGPPQPFYSMMAASFYPFLALSSIPFGLFMAYRFYKATFLEIVLKYGAALLIILILHGFFFLLILQLPRLLLSNTDPNLPPLISQLLRLPLSNTQQMLLPILLIVIWLGVYTLYSPLRDHIYRLIDRYVFKRYRHALVLERFNDRLRSVTDQASLMAATATALKQAFAVDAVHFLPAAHTLTAGLAKAMAEQKANVLFRQQIGDGTLEARLEKRRVALVLAIRCSEEPAMIILVGPRAHGQDYWSEDLSMLRAVMAQTGRTLENLRLHAERRRQAIDEEYLRKLAVQAKLKALRAQIDPHFLFNALNSVASLISDNPKAAEELIADVAELFRHAFKTDREFIPLDQEIDLVEIYLKVEKVRLGDKLQFEKTISPEALAVKIPALTIQPLIENAVRHGIGCSTSGGTIGLSAIIKDHHLRVTVQDTGAGIAPSELDRIFARGVGLANVNHRLIGLYGPEAKLRIDSHAGQGTVVAFAIPLAAGSGAEVPPEQVNL